MTIEDLIKQTITSTLDTNLDNLQEQLVKIINETLEEKLEQLYVSLRLQQDDKTLMLQKEKGVKEDSFIGLDGQSYIVEHKYKDPEVVNEPEEEWGPVEASREEVEEALKGTIDVKPPLTTNPELVAKQQADEAEKQKVRDAKKPEPEKDKGNGRGQLEDFSLADEAKKHPVEIPVKDKAAPTPLPTEDEVMLFMQAMGRVHKDANKVAKSYLDELKASSITVLRENNPEAYATFRETVKKRLEDR